jgi:hypothetical protein
MENNNAETPTATHIHDGADGANPDFPNARNKKTAVDILENAGMETGLELEISRAIVRYIDHIVDEKIEKSHNFQILVKNLINNSDLETHIENIAETRAEDAISDSDKVVSEHQVEEIVEEQIGRYFSYNLFNISKE